MTGLGKLSAHDRALGARARARAPGSRGARLIALAMAPSFQLLVGALIARRNTRATGLATMVAAGSASLVARTLRDRLGRPRPGPRAEGGMPSRHAAAAGAIATTLTVRGSLLAVPAWAGAAVGGAARVLTGDHEPGDIAAGTILGAMVAGVLTRTARLLVGWRR